MAAAATGGDGEVEEGTARNVVFSYPKLQVSGILVREGKDFLIAFART